ncbi:unnamed protein product [Adineta ricciae]|uniref:peptidylprolyl isomerase n=1 Tax=Adineta ricciae TaxID=249248 RepID=A0A816F5C4_ADIRI|nr:unnamed protein product [Adineta ricciae]CAF1658413.1 unnamed protein product [Adineta ricciae]
MFSNPIYNLPSQFNESLLSQNLSGLSLNRNPSHQDQSSPEQQQQQQPSPQQQQEPSQQDLLQDNLDFDPVEFAQQQQQLTNDIEGFVPTTFDDTNIKWASPEDINISYQRGSPFVRQYNNTMIDDYYKKFVRPITEYVSIPTTGQPTYVYQNLNGQEATNETLSTESVMPEGALPGDATALLLTTLSQTNLAGVEEKKHKKKHKKRSSKHAHHDTEKHIDPEQLLDERKPEMLDGFDLAPPLPIPPNDSLDVSYQQQQQVATNPLLNKLGGTGPQMPMRNESNPVVYFDIEVDGEARGRLIMELFSHVLPRTAQNFLSLCLNEHGFGYRLSYFHRIIPDFMAQGGDFEKSNGTGGYSIYGEKFDDEGFPYPHDRIGLLSMANSGPNTNGSQFFITFVPCPHLDNKHVVFGQVLQGFHILKDLEMSGSENGDVSREVKIAHSDQLQ